MRQFIFGMIIGAIVTTAAMHFYVDSIDEEEKLNQEIAAYYAHETATLISPHNLRERMSHGKDDYILVDVRAEEDYFREHIVTAINIDTGKSLDQVLADFQSVAVGNPNKEIIIYCYSTACMNGRKAGNFLAENGIYVKELTIGWNEWRYDWQMWNYETEWDVYAVEDFVISGVEPGIVPESARSIKPCPIDGALAC